MLMSESSGPYIDRPLKDYVETAASKASTPGGGSVSALAGALGTTMASMAANFTVGKKKYADVQDSIKEQLAKLDAVRGTLLAAMQRDTEAYAEVSAAYGMPKDDDEQKKARTAAIQKALKVAMEPPLEALRAARDGIVATRRLLDIANKNLITDVGVAALLLEAGARGAYYNVAINLNGLKDAELVEKTGAECTEALAQVAGLAKEVSEGIDKSLAKKAK
jgi:formiminotetrahydrofolate cyclodeaminase